MKRKKSETFKAAIFDTAIFAFLFWVIYFFTATPTEDELLNLSFNSILTLAFFISGVVLSFVCYFAKIKTLGIQLFETPQKNQVIDNSWKKVFWKYQLSVAFVVACFCGVLATQLNFFELFSPDGFAGAQRIFVSLFNPNFEVLPRAILSIVETIFMAFMATILAIPIAFVLSFLCAKNIMNYHPFAQVVYMTLRTILNIARSIEPLIWAIIFSVWVGIGPFAGMLALWFHSFASLTKNYSELAESVDEGPIQAIASTGANRIQLVWFAIVPQVILPYTAFTIYRWDINVRMATVIGLVGGGGIGTLLNQYQGQALWQEVGTLVMVIAAAVWLMDATSAYIREALK